MSRLTIAALGALLLDGCAGTHISKPAACDGKHRRPANLYGTILPTLPIPLPASQGAGQSMVAPDIGQAPQAPSTPPPAVAPLPTPGTGTLPAKPPAADPGSTAPAAIRTSARDVAPSFHAC